MKKEKSMDELIYEDLLRQFDILWNSFPHKEAFEILHDNGCVYVDDLLKDKNFFPTEVFLDADLYPDDSEGHKLFTKGFEYWPKWYLHVDVLGYNCAFPVDRLPWYIGVFKKLSRHRGKKKLDWTVLDKKK